MKIRRADGAVHFSDLKMMARSPAHYRHAVEASARATKRYLNVGTLAHMLVLGKRPNQRIAVWSGKVRRGKAWDAFKLENKGKDIVTIAEWRVASEVADAVLSNPVAYRILSDCRKEVAMRWTDAGIECATGGVDFIDTNLGLLGELKTTECASTTKFPRGAINMAYHAQLAWYAAGAGLAFGAAIDRHIIIAAETSEPYPVTVFEVPRHIIDEGWRMVIGWLERLRVCEDCDDWGGYASDVVPLSVPWMTEADDDDDGFVEPKPDSDEAPRADIFAALGGAP